jgi:hypothetical protein
MALVQTAPILTLISGCFAVSQSILSAWSPSNVEAKRRALFIGCLFGVAGFFMTASAIEIAAS